MEQERERQIKCYKALWRSRKVSGGIVTVRRGVLRGADRQKEAKGQQGGTRVII